MSARPAAMMFPVTRAVMVEARTNAAQDIRERFRGDPRFSVVEAAISDEWGETVFHVNEMKDSSSILNVNRFVTEATFGKSFGTVEEIGGHRAALRWGLCDAGCPEAPCWRTSGPNR